MTPEQKIEQVKKKYSGRLRIAMQKAALEIVQPIVDLVKFRVRELGQNANNEAMKIKKSTIEYRQRYEKNLHPDTSPDKANLTATGQLLDAIFGKAARGKVIVQVKKTKRRKELSGAKSNLTNDQLRAYIEENPSNEFLKLSPKEKEEVTAIATEIINRELRGLLK